MNSLEHPADMVVSSEDELLHVVVEDAFVITPVWVVDAEISDRACRLYSILRCYANNMTGYARPSRKTLAQRCRTSVKSVDRALRELADIGAVEITHRWSAPDRSSYSVSRDAKHTVPAPSRYVLKSSPPTRARGRDTGDARTRSSRTRENNSSPRRNSRPRATPGPGTHCAAFCGSHRRRRRTCRAHPYPRRRYSRLPQL